jgi:hypothetical protein
MMFEGLNLEASAGDALTMPQTYPFVLDRETPPKSK